MSAASRILAIGAEALTKMNCAEIAEVAGCHRSYPARVLRRAGIPVLGDNPDATAKSRIIAMGAERLAGMKVKEVAKAAGCSAAHAWLILRSCGFSFVHDLQGTRSRSTDAVGVYLRKGLTPTQIAKRLGCTPNAVRQAAFRIRQAGA